MKRRDQLGGSPRGPAIAGDRHGDEGGVIGAARQGSVEALGTLFESIRGHLRLAAIRDLPRGIQGKASVSDLVQDVMATAHERFMTFRGESEAEFFGWMRMILRSTAIDRFRRRQALRRQQGTPGIPLHDVGSRERGLADDADGRPEAVAMRVEDGRVVVDALAALPLEQHRVLWLRHWEGKTFEQIAVDMERSEAAVRKIWCRGLERLETLIRERASGARFGSER